MVGPYRLFTDVDDEDLVRGLDRLASELENVYVERYGVLPQGRAAEAVVLFRRQQSYDSYESAQSRVSGLHAVGLAGHGVVALWQGQRDHGEVAATLVHEIVHLLNRRAIGPALPPWMDEGIADDLAQARIDENWTLHPGELGGSENAGARHRVLEGGRASLVLLQKAMESGELPSLAELTAWDWERFVLTDERGRNYAHASFLVRYLSSGDLATGWRSFLSQVAAGGGVEQGAFVEALGVSWDRLEGGFRLWLRLQRLAHPGEEARELDQSSLASHEP
jgi:hypothetical protein